MEAEAGGPGSKRRKSAALVVHVRVPSPAEAHDSDPAAKQDDGGADRISDLPDTILGEIISLLPTGDGARTQILSPRWRHLWRSAPLNLDCRELTDNLWSLPDFTVTQILSSHTAPVRRFCVPTHHYLGVPETTLELWLRSPGLDNLQELEFICIPNQLCYLHILPPPASTFRFSATLLAFTLGQSRLSDDITRALHFPLLKHLTLQEVTLSDSALHSFISGCPVLECLLIYGSFGLRSPKINSSTLRSISIQAGYRYLNEDIEIKELVIENAPCLQRLLGLYFGYGLHVSVLSAPKLEAFGCFFTWDFSSTKLVLGSSVMQEPHVNRLTMARCTIKILAVHSCELSLDTIIQLLAYFPCLEKLYVVSNYLRLSNISRTKHQNLITSLDIRLKTIVLDSYRGKMSEVNFVTFFVLNVKVLELMTLVVPAKCYNEKFLELQPRKLQLENKASRGAQFHFTPKSNSHLDNVMKMKDARDLDSWDPFIC